VIDCTKEQHERLQELIGHQLAEDRLPNRPDLGKGVESGGACWDLDVYLSEIGKIGANTLVDDGTGSGTTVRACVKAGKKGANPLVDDGTGSGTTVKSCVKAARWHTQESCIACNVARRTRGSDKCNPCAVAVMYAVFGT
jgi:hypothetical protein